MTMSVWEKLKEIFSGKFSSPEDEINNLTEAMLPLWKKETSKEDKLDILRRIANSDIGFKLKFTLLLNHTQKQESELTRNDVICMYIVSVTFKVLVLLGYDPACVQHRTSEDNRRIRERCALQRARIDQARINQESLCELLFQSLCVKAAWRTFNDPRSDWAPITSPEIWARDDWWKKHSMPQDRQSEA
jgi:hypothetical protein